MRVLLVCALLCGCISSDDGERLGDPPVECCEMQEAPDPSPCEDDVSCLLHEEFRSDPPQWLEPALPQEAECLGEVCSIVLTLPEEKWLHTCAAVVEHPLAATLVPIEIRYEEDALSWRSQPVDRCLAPQYISEMRLELSSYDWKILQGLERPTLRVPADR